jgi:hypothetical protein
MEEYAGKIAAEVKKIEKLTDSLKQDLKNLKHINAAYGVILIELELLSMNIAELRKNIEK